MSLQDAVVSADPLLVEGADGVVFDLPGARSLADAVKSAPVRYVLDDACAALVAQTAFADRNSVDQCLDLLRFPVTAFWIEWSDQGRANVMRESGLVDPLQDKGKLGRAGAFVQADETGRRGEISIVWDSDQGLVDLSPLTLEFDLDDPDFCEKAPCNAISRTIRLRELDILSELYRRVRYKLSNPWREYYQRYAGNEQEFERIYRTALETVAGDFPFAAAFVLVLAARGALTYMPSQLDRLNKSRVKKGKPALLDHLNVRLALDTPSSDAGGDGSGGLKSSPRLHHVCGHVVRRGTSVHWRRAHLRGNPAIGVISARTLNLTVRSPQNLVIDGA